MKKATSRRAASKSISRESTFRTTLFLAGKTATGFVIPPEIVERLGAGKRPPVRVTINGFTYRNTIAVMGGKYCVGVSAEHRGPAGVKAGDVVDVRLELDNAPRTVTMPPELKRALAREQSAQEFFAGLSYSKQRWFADWINGAKTDDTRERRVEKSVEALRTGKSRA